MFVEKYDVFLSRKNNWKIKTYYQIRKKSQNICNLHNLPYTFKNHQCFVFLFRFILLCIVLFKKTSNLVKSSNEAEMSAKYEQELSWNFPTLSQVLQQNDKMITSTGSTSYKKYLVWK